MKHTLELSDEPDAVPLARHFVRERLRGTPLEHRSADSELILTELVTNARLHGAPPVTVGVEVSAEAARLEVADGSPGAPVNLVQNPDTMTGRGLMLVQALSDRWGVDRRAQGKLVWAEVGARATVAGNDAPAATALPAAGVEDDPVDGSDAARYTIELGDVPTDLLLAAKGHVDSIVREFALVTSGAASGQSAAVPGDLARLIETVGNRFREARESIKRQAVAAAVAGEERTRLMLRLPLSAADAGREYLDALDEVDAYARAARLLTLETPPQHRAFRKWYVNSLVDQLTAIARGGQPRPPGTFEQFLLDEVEVVATAHRATDRAARLQQVTASLAGAISTEEVAGVVVSQGVEALGASAGALLLPTPDERFHVVAALNYSEELLQVLQDGGVRARLPAAVAVRSGQPVWVESPEQRDKRYPGLRAVEPGTISLCAVPLSLAGRVLGVLRLSFDSPHLFDEEERAFVLAFCAQTVQALDRAELYSSERRARAAAETSARRLNRLNAVTAALAGASDVEQVGEVVTHEAHLALDAAVSALCLVEGDRMRVVQMRGGRPGTMARWQTFPLAANLPASDAVRTTKPVVLHSRAEMEHRYPALAGQTPQEQTLVCVPLSVGGRALGALAFTFLPPYVVDDDAVDLMMTVGRQCALAIERANLVSAEREARRRSGFLADSTARVASSLDPGETLENLVDLIVPELADWSAVYMADEVGRVVAGTAKHRDARLTLVMRGLQQRRTSQVALAGEIGEVLLTGRRLHYSVVSAQQQQQVYRLFGDEETAGLAAFSVLAVPFVRRERILGLLVMARVEQPAYTDSDLMLATELADRAAVALDNASRFLRERDVAVTLQRSLLPQVLPRVPGLALAWRYFPGATGTNVGGDWYDVIPLEGGRVALIIGDVMGRGLRAAAVMGQLRATARAHVYANLGPADVLARTDTELMRLEQEQIATALLAVLDPGTGTLTVASAGHLPPLVRTDDGAVVYLDVTPGPPLGTGTGGYTELQVTLPEGATVLLYTDGLVEDRRLPIDEGLATLAAAATVSREPELLCDRALVALGRDSEHDDDTAMLAVHVSHL
ncbi:MAG: SpoIIE family protein phosphatase [Actinomycetota bacterium]|nr:SpoIIE family protein phosphatase [Actinomycetota bacterium]